MADTQKIFRFTPETEGEGEGHEREDSTTGTAVAPSTAGNEEEPKVCILCRIQVTHIIIRCTVYPYF